MAWRQLASPGTSYAALKALCERLINDLDPDRWGFAQFNDLIDVEQRAVVSDQIVTSAWTLRTTLIEARLHLADASELSASGLTLPRVGNWDEDFRHQVRVEMHLGGVFRALGSALDCLAATAVGVTRAPASIQKASYRDFTSLADWALNRNLGTDEQRAVWLRVFQTAEASDDGRFPGWIEWLLEMRNALVHRGRHMSMLIPRSQPRDIVLVSDNPMALSPHIVKSDFHFHAKPWLPEMEHLADSKSAYENWLDETALVTVSGLIDLVCELVEKTSAVLLAVWHEVEDGTLVLTSPSAKWRLLQPSTAAARFHGFATAYRTMNLSEMVVSPSTARRLYLAEQLRLRRHDAD